MSNTGPIESQHMASSASVFDPLTFDIERYQAMLDNSGMTKEEEQEFLEAIWTIVVGFVDLSFGLHPLQQVPDAQQCLAGVLASTFEDLLSLEPESAETLDHGVDDGLATREPR